MPKAEDIVKRALDEVGITEYPPNSNNVKYNTEYYGREVSGPKYPWCCAFVWWVFSRFSPCLVKKTATCTDLGQWFKDNGKWSSSPHIGDVVFFKFKTNDRWTNHVGIVTGLKGNIVETVEGNTSISSDDNGGAVMQRRRSSNIVGYGRPSYSEKYEVAPVQPKRGYRYGIDVSACQSSVDFTKVKQAGFEFVLLRSTTKNGLPDQKFDEYWNGAAGVGMKITGVYKLCYAHSAWEAQNEAEGVVRLLRSKGHKCDIWLDMEDDGGQQIYSKDIIACIITAFLTTCVKAGYEVGIYCNMDWYKNHIRDDIRNICRFWIARYPNDDTGMVREDMRPDVKGAVMWQYSSKGKLPGIPGDVDLDVML